MASSSTGGHSATLADAATVDLAQSPMAGTPQSLDGQEEIPSGLSHLVGSAGVPEERRRKRKRRIKNRQLTADRVKRPEFIYGEGAPQPTELYLCERLHAKLKPHQKDGVRWLWSHFGRGVEKCGCMLADHMGLGKTIQTIALVNGLLGGGNCRLPLAPAEGAPGSEEKEKAVLSDSTRKSRDNSSAPVFQVASRKRVKKNGLGVKRVLIITPTTVAQVWQSEALKFVGPVSRAVFNMKNLYNCGKTASTRERRLREWHTQGGVLVLGYEMFRTLVLNDYKNTRTYLCNPGPDLLVLDEGHRLRNSQSQIYLAMQKIRTKRRLVLTGYPMQNHLMEYFAMVDFIRPSFLGSKEDFRNTFEIPILNGQCSDSNLEDIQIAKQQTWVLHNHVAPIVLRRDGLFLRKQLPPKYEWVLFCRLSNLQYKLYKAYARERLRRYLERGSTAPGKGILQSYHMSLAIVNDPDVLASALKERLRLLQQGNAEGQRGFDGVNWLDGPRRSTASGSKYASIVPAPLEAIGKQLTAGEACGSEGPESERATKRAASRPAPIAAGTSTQDLRSSPVGPRSEGAETTAEHASNAASLSAPPNVVDLSTQDETFAGTMAGASEPGAGGGVANLTTVTYSHRFEVEFHEKQLGITLMCITGRNAGQLFCSVSQLVSENMNQDDAARSQISPGDEVISLNGVDILPSSTLKEVVGMLTSINDRPLRVGFQRPDVPSLEDGGLEFVEDVDASMVDEKFAWAFSLLRGHELGNAEHSCKLQVLLRILVEAYKVGERVVVFSQSLRTLDSIATMLESHNAFIDNDPTARNSLPRFPFVRIDGRTSQEVRHFNIKKMNDSKSRIRVILISTKAGGEGISLTGANRMVLFDCCWNPSYDHQAMCRSYRYGQTKPVHVYRLIASGTMEEHVYERQVLKETLALHVVDDRASQRQAGVDVEQLFNVSKLKLRQGEGKNALRRDIIKNDDILKCITEDGWIKEWYQQDTLFRENKEERCIDEIGLSLLQEYQDSNKKQKGSASNIDAFFLRQRNLPVVAAAATGAPPPTSAGRHATIIDLSDGNSIGTPATEGSSKSSAAPTTSKDDGNQGGFGVIDLT